jgi:hypothetical protein
LLALPPGVLDRGAASGKGAGARFVGSSPITGGLAGAGKSGPGPGVTTAEGMPPSTGTHPSLKTGSHPLSSTTGARFRWNNRWKNPVRWGAHGSRRKQLNRPFAHPSMLRPAQAIKTIAHRAPRRTPLPGASRTGTSGRVERMLNIVMLLHSIAPLADPLASSLRSSCAARRLAPIRSGSFRGMLVDDVASAGDPGSHALPQLSDRGTAPDNDRPGGHVVARAPSTPRSGRLRYSRVGCLIQG